MLDIPLQDRFRETRIFGLRIMVVSVFITLAVLTLLGRLVYLQAINFQQFDQRREANRLTPLPIPPVRGLILDRNGIPLAQNYPVLSLEVTPEQVTDMPALLERLGKLVRLTEEDLEQFNKQRRKRPKFEPQVLRAQLTEEEASRLAVNQTELQGVNLEPRLQRHYPFGPMAVHLIGYVGRINEKELDTIDRRAYRGTHHIGKLGVERTYEQTLLGKVGIKQVVTNAFGKEVNRNASKTDEKPRAGGNLYLNIDARLQAVAEQALGAHRGAAVALDPRNGEILAFASTPTYDPNPFVNGIDHASYNALLNDINKPLINRALNGQYAPGSTIKPFFSLAGLDGKYTTPKDTVICRGAFRLPRDSHRYRDWKKSGHGVVNVHDAIVQSCDVFFYRLAVTMGIDYMNRFLSRLGFGRRTGIDLYGESSGLIPNQKYIERRGSPWYLGETVVTGIGQGPLLVTPLQLAQATATLAMHGKAIRPRVLLAVEDPESRKRTGATAQSGSVLTLNDVTNFDQVIQGMVDVVHSKHGTGQRIGWDAKYRIAGKTGTAQVKSVAQGETYDAKALDEFHRDHALFISFAPADDPKIAVAVIVENGGHGSRAAAPVARAIMDAWLLPDKAGKLPPQVKPIGASQ